MRRFLLSNFRVVHGVDQWAKRRFTPAGLLVLIGTGTAAVFGIDFGASFSLQLATLGAALLGLAVCCAPLFRGRFRIHRELPRHGVVGEPLVYAVHLRNLSERDQMGLLFQERLEERAPTVEEFRNAPEPRRGRLNFFDRRVGYPRWAWLLRRNRGALADELALPALPAGEPVRVEARLEPVRRGYVRLLGAHISRPDPLGLFKAVETCEQRDSVLVLPKHYPVSWLDAAGARANARGGASRAFGAGGSQEFARVREYRPGDALRYIHWPSWARLGEPIVKEFQDQSFSRRALILDTFCRAADQRFEDAVSAAASLARGASHLETRLELLCVGPRAFSFEAGGGAGIAERSLEILACAEVCRDQPFAALTRVVSGSLDGVHACACVLLEWDPERQSLIRGLRALGLDVLVLVMTEDRLEADPGPMADRPERLRFIPRGGLREALAELSRRARPLGAHR